MSYEMSSIDCIAIKITESYYEALKKDIQLFKENKLILDNERQRDFLENYAEADDEEDFEDFDCFIDNEADSFHRYEGGRHSENYAYQRPLNLETGTLGEGDIFDGYVYEFSYGSASIYKPEFKSKEDFISKLKEELYIPTTFDLENNVIFLTGVQGG